MFIRSFSERQINALSGGENTELFARLKQDILSGEVFPAVRKNEMHFYYKGGCLYKFSHGRFTYNAAFDKYGQWTEKLSSYEKAKMQVYAKFQDASGKATERQRLDGLNRHTFCTKCDSKVVVLDIEINFNGTFCAGKKCDIALFNTDTQEIMFAEGKVFSDSRVNVKIGRSPEVIEQVNIYTKSIAEQSDIILEQYENTVDILKKLFGVDLPAPKKIILPAKLLVYEVPKRLTENQKYSIKTINDALGSNNAAWYDTDDNPSIDEIWGELCKL